MSVTVSVPEAAVLLGVSERTVWRRIKDGRLPSRRDGRSVRVDLDVARRIGEAPARYGPDVTAHQLTPGPWPFTAEKVAAQKARLRAQRMAALEEIRRVAATTRPDPDGLTFLDYLQDEDDPPPGEGRE